MKTAIVYCSTHHSNTKKLIDAIAIDHEVTLFDATTIKTADLTEFDCVGFASGIYFRSFHKSVLAFADQNLPENQSVFLMYTYGIRQSGYTNAIMHVLQEKSAKLIGTFGCRGYDTFGPFKFVGGIAKGHPDCVDCANAVAFYHSLL